MLSIQKAYKYISPFQDITTIYSMLLAIFLMHLLLKNILFCGLDYTSLLLFAMKTTCLHVVLIFQVPIILNLLS